MRSLALSLFVLVALASNGCDRDLSEPGTPPQTPGRAVDVDDLSSPQEDEVPSNGETSDDDPVVWNVSLDRDQATPGDTVTLTARCDIHPGWHIYGVTGPTGVAQPTRLDLSLPTSLTSDSDWKLPTATFVVGFKGQESHYLGRNLFSIALKVDDDASPGPATVQCTVGYQACTDVSCLPPASQVFEVPLLILAAKETK